MDANTINQYQQMIEALMSPDNNVRGQAEAAFNQAKANPDVMVSALGTCCGIIRASRHALATKRSGVFFFQRGADAALLLLLLLLLLPGASSARCCFARR